LTPVAEFVPTPTPAAALLSTPAPAAELLPLSVPLVLAPLLVPAPVPMLEPAPTEPLAPPLAPAPPLLWPNAGVAQNSAAASRPNIVDVETRMFAFLQLVAFEITEL
jgi:hypothetical protein